MTRHLIAVMICVILPTGTWAGNSPQLMMTDGGALVAGSNVYTPVHGGNITNTGGLWNATENKRWMVMPASGTWSNMRVSLTAAPGSSKTYTFTLNTNGNNSPLTCSITGTSATSCTDVADSSATAAGDFVDWLANGTAGATTPTASLSVQFTPTQSNYYVIGGGGVDVTTSLTRFPVDGFGAGTSGNEQGILSPAGTVSQLWCSITAAPGSAITRTFAYEKAAVATAVTCAITGTSATSCSDLTHSVADAAKDLLTFVDTVSGGTAAAANANCSAIFVPTTSGQFPIFINSQAISNTALPTYVDPEGHLATTNGTEANQQEVASNYTGSWTLSNMYESNQTSPGASKGWAFVFQVNSSTPSSEPNCSITGASGTASTSCSDTTDSYTTIDADLLGWQVSPTGAAPASTIFRIGLTGLYNAPANTVSGSNDGLIINGGKMTINGGKVTVY